MPFFFELAYSTMRTFDGIGDAVLVEAAVVFFVGGGLGLGWSLRRQSFGAPTGCVGVSSEHVRISRALRGGGGVASKEAVLKGALHVSVWLERS